MLDVDFDRSAVRLPFSLIATIKNERRGIIEFLRSIENQSVPPNEIIMVDGGSTDGTVELVRQTLCGRTQAVKLLERPGLNIAAGRNVGIQQAGNELIVLADAGCRLDRDFCKNLIGCFARIPELDLASGVFQLMNAPIAHLSKDWQRLDWSEFLPSARTLAIRRSLATRIGGFPEHLTLTGEDTLFDINYRRVSARWAFNRKSVVHWDSPNNQEAAGKLEYSYGWGDGESGIGEYRLGDGVYELIRTGPYGDLADHPPILRQTMRGFAAGRKLRSEIEFHRRGVKAVVLILAEDPITRAGNPHADTALRLIAQNIKVVYVSARLHGGLAKKWLDTDLTLLELGHAQTFNWEDLLARYAAFSDRLCVFYPTLHPVLGKLVEKLCAKTGNQIKVVSSAEELRTLLAAKNISGDVSSEVRRGGQSHFCGVLPQKSGQSPPRQKSGQSPPSGAEVHDAPISTPTSPGPLSVAFGHAAGRSPARYLCTNAVRFVRVARSQGVLAAVRKASRKLRAARTAEIKNVNASLLRLGNGSCYDLISLPIMPWGSRFQRSQQLLSQFARQGTRVFRIDRSFLVNDSRDYAMTQVAENILHVSLRNSRDMSIYREAIDEAALEQMMRSLETLRADAAIGNAVCIVELPFWYPLARELRRRFGWKIVYDCMDEHAGFSGNAEEMVSSEEDLVHDADLVVVTSDYLKQKMDGLGRDCTVVRNATDFRHFATLPENGRLRSIPRPIIGYYGSISEWFDFDLVEYAARRRPDWSFVLVGSSDHGGTFGSLTKLPNVHFLGEKPYAELPQYLYWFDVCTIPFRLTKLIEATNPVKFYEYISSGKPVVSVMLPELTRHSDCLYLAKDRREFVDQLSLAVAERPEDHRARRIELARQNTWDNRHRRLKEAVDRLFPRVSIIVVTYNNLALTKACVNSIFANSQYPNFELIVVDNASGDETPEFLRGLAQQRKTVRAILNRDNRGFAAANNQGLRSATGDYIILLNNDTVVTAGWISKLIRHLADRKIGMVGPATNMCGNESIIHVPYDERTFVGFDDFLRKYHRRHAEPESFDIDMLSMFCVALRRETVDEIGELDERFGVGMFEDTDYSQRLKDKGYRLVSARDVFVHHHCKSSFGKLPDGEYSRIYLENRKRFEMKWGITSRY